METSIRATIVISHDDVNDYFLVINLDTGEEVRDFSTEDFDTWRYDDNYDEEEIVAKIAGICNIGEYNLIHW